MSAILLYDMHKNPIPRYADTRTARITVMGDCASGKTTFILRFITDSFTDVENGIYMEDIYHKPINMQTLARDINSSSKLYDGTEIMKHDSNSYSTVDVQLLDTAPFEIADFSDIRNEQILQSDAFIICFDPTNKESFLNLRTYQRRIERVRGINDKVPVIIVATKSDLVSERKVDDEEILQVLKRFEIPYESDYFEISSKLNINIKQLLFRTLTKIEEYKSQQKNDIMNKKIHKNNNSYISDSTKVILTPSNNNISQQYPPSTSSSSVTNIEQNSYSNQEKKMSKEEKKLQSDSIRSHRITSRESVDGNISSERDSRNLKTVKKEEKTTTSSQNQCCIIC